MSSKIFEPPPPLAQLVIFGRTAVPLPLVIACHFCPPPPSTCRTLCFYAPFHPVPPHHQLSAFCFVETPSDDDMTYYMDARLGGSPQCVHLHVPLLRKRNTARAPLPVALGLRRACLVTITADGGGGGEGGGGGGAFCNIRHG